MQYQIKKRTLMKTFKEILILLTMALTVACMFSDTFGNGIPDGMMLIIISLYYFITKVACRGFPYSLLPWTDHFVAAYSIFKVANLAGYSISYAPV